MNTISLSGLTIDNAFLGNTLMFKTVYPWYEFKQGKQTDNQLGYRYVVMLTVAGREGQELEVKIPGARLIPTAVFGAKVQVDGLNVKLYYASDKKSYFISAKANGIALVEG